MDTLHVFMLHEVVHELRVIVKAMECCLGKVTGLYRFYSALHLRLHFILYSRDRLTELLVHQHVLISLFSILDRSNFEIINLFHIALVN